MEKASGDSGQGGGMGVVAGGYLMRGIDSPGLSEHVHLLFARFPTAPLTPPCVQVPPLDD